MKLTKEDYMRLPKERLAELLVERDKLGFAPTWVNQPMQTTPCYAPDGICTNPQMDCINCPKRGSSSGRLTTINTLGE